MDSIMDRRLLILWLADELGTASFITQTESLDFLFQPLRLVAVAFFLVFAGLAVFPAGGNPRWRHAAICALTCYGAVSLAVIAVICTGVFCYTSSSSTAKDVIVSESRTLSWVFELLLWWSLILLGVSAATLRSWRASWQRIPSNG